MLNLVIKSMLWLSEYELAIAIRYSSNFKYICDCKERVRHWEKELRINEVNHEA